MTITEKVQRAMKKNRWFTTADLAETVYGDANFASVTARRIRALRASGVGIESRRRRVDNTLIWQYRRVS